MSILITHKHDFSNERSSKDKSRLSKRNAADVNRSWSNDLRIRATCLSVCKAYVGPIGASI